MKIKTTQSVKDLQKRSIIKDRKKDIIESFEDGHTISETFSGHKAMMCPNCFNFTIIETDYTISARVKENSQFLYSIPDVIIATDEGCKFCGADEMMLDIDPNIAESIRILNNKGYTTRFCCEGHENDSITPYIMFTNKFIISEVIDTLPDSWYVDIEDIRNALKYNINTLVIRADRFNKVNSLKDLEDWANALPNVIDII